MFDDQELRVSSYSWCASGCAVHGAETRAVLVEMQHLDRSSTFYTISFQWYRPSNHFNKLGYLLCSLILNGTFPFESDTSRNKQTVDSGLNLLLFYFYCLTKLHSWKELRGLKPCQQNPLHKLPKSPHHAHRNKAELNYQKKKIASQL